MMLRNQFGPNASNLTSTPVMNHIDTVKSACVLAFVMGAAVGYLLAA